MKSFDLAHSATMAPFEHDHNNGGPAATSQRKKMMQLLSLLLSLSAEQLLNLLSVALCLALAAGMNDRLGALIAACLTLALMMC